VLLFIAILEQETMMMATSNPHHSLALFLVDPFPVLAVTLATAILELQTSGAAFKLVAVLLVFQNKTIVTHFSLFQISLDKLSAVFAILQGTLTIKLFRFSK
jgi:hypothetical protein